jgi:hypothetical protein
MKTNWKTAINKINSARLKIPDGWETRDQVAASLECDPDRVADILKPGIAAGEIERAEFPTWDESRRMTVRVVCYRVKPPESKATSKKSK